MSVGKEELMVIQQLASEQHIVLLDDEGQAESADMGLLDNPENRRKVQRAIAMLKSFAWNKTTSFTAGRHFHAFIAWERDDDHYNGQHIFIRWFKAMGRMPAYFEITGHAGYMGVDEHNSQR